MAMVKWYHSFYDILEVDMVTNDVSALASWFHLHHFVTSLPQPHDHVKLCDITSSTWLSVCQSTHQYISVYLSISICLPTTLSIYVFISLCLPACFSVYLFIYPSVSVSLPPPLVTAFVSAFILIFRFHYIWSNDITCGYIYYWESSWKYLCRNITCEMVKNISISHMKC